jgi:RNA polymerase sigma-70 factor (ECF subfamily)
MEHQNHPKPSEKAAGDAIERQFLESYELYSDAIYRHCLFRVYSPERAEELMQDTYMKTWMYLSKGNEVENIRAFLYRVANNLVIDNSRKKKEDSLEVLMDAHPDFEPSANPIPQLENVMLLETVLEKMKQLPADARQILVMRHIDDMDPKEIASVLGITANNASVRINRAMRQLQQILNKDHE